VETVAVSLHGPRIPEVVDQIRAGTFHVFRCQGCDVEYRADGPLIYTDFDKKHWIGEFPVREETAWALLEQQPLDSFRRSMIDRAPAFLRADAAGFTVRTVFGLPALAEKILLFDAGWDDRVVETIKLRTVLGHGGVLEPAARPRVLHADPDSFDLLLRVPDDGGDEQSFVHTVTRAEAEAVASDPDWAPVLVEQTRGPYVDIGRMMLDGRTTSTYATVG
jgi:hypothetical protein